MNAKLYRSTADRMVAGVCGGLGQYLGIDPVLVRIFFVLLTIGGGSGVLVYLLLWILIPEGDQGQLASAETIRGGAEEIAAKARSFGADMRATLQARNPQTSLIIGAALVLLGLLFLGQNLQLSWLRWLSADLLWPVLLMAAGVALIWRRAKGATP
jgi:phage shock protein C